MLTRPRLRSGGIVTWDDEILGMNSSIYGAIISTAASRIVDHMELKVIAECQIEGFREFVETGVKIESCDHLILYGGHASPKYLR